MTKRLLSAFLSFLFVFNTAVFSFSAGAAVAHATVADTAGEVLLFPLEVMTGTSYNPNQPVVPVNNPLCAIGEIFTDNACRKQDFAEMNTNRQKCEEAKGTFDEVLQTCTKLPWAEQPNVIGTGNNRDLVAGIAGGVAGYAATSLVTAFGSASGSAVTTTASILKDNAKAILNEDFSSVVSPASANNLSMQLGDWFLEKTNLTGAASSLDSTFSKGLFGGGTNASGAFSEALGGAAISGGVAALVTLFMGGSIKDAAKAAVKSAITSLAAQMLVGNATFSLFGATSGIFFAIPWALPVGIVLGLLMQMLCPIVVVELPNGTVTMPSSFLVGKINKQMKGDSWEKLVDSHQSLVTSPGKEAGQKLPLKLNSSTGEIVPDTTPNTGEELGVVIGEVLPEILNLDSLKVFDLQFSAKENGEWFMDQNGHPEYFSAARTSHWKDVKAELEAMKWGGIVSSQQSLVPSQNSPVSPTKDYRLATSDFPPVFTNTSGSEFTVNVPQNAHLKLLFEGGIQTAYHGKKLNVLARFRPVLTWFYALTDNTFLGKIVEREIFAKEGFTLEQKVGDEWVKVHQWVTYEDQKRAVIVSSQQSLVSSPNSPASLTKDYRLATSDYITFRVMYDPAYLKLSGVSASIEPNPEYTETELISSNLFPSLKETDNQLETIETGTYYKFVFHLPKIDESSTQREVFMKTNGYYHPLTDKAYLDEMRQNYVKVSGWINKIMNND